MPLTVKALYTDPAPYAGQLIALRGWLRTVRDSKAFGFLELNDGSTVKNIQIIIDSILHNFSQVVKLGAGAAVRAEGTLVLTPDARQPFELKATSVEIEGASAPEYPLQKKRHSREYLRTIAHLRPRANTFHAAFKIRSEAAFAIHEFFHRRGFVYAHTPIITGSDAEGAGELFRVSVIDPQNPPLTSDGRVDYSRDFFNKQTGLTVSGQLQAEAFALAFAQTYTFGPTFRAENSNTPRHAAEFWMVEPEIAFADLRDDMNLAEELIKSVIGDVQRACPDEMDFLARRVDPSLPDRLAQLQNAAFVRLTYTQAVAELQKHRDRFECPLDWGADPRTEHERFLVEHVAGGPVFITDYPRDIKAFYMRLNDDGRTVAAMDLLTPVVGELIGGSQREERIDILTARMEALGLSQAEYNWYLDLRRFGGTRHAGFGLGFERLLMLLTGLDNIRDVIPFPRTAGAALF